MPETRSDAPTCGEHRALAPTILVVAREPEIRSVTRRILERRSFETLEARDAAEAIVHFEDHRREIRGVVVDLGLPESDAANVAAALRGVHPRLPILFTGGFGEVESCEWMRPDSATDFLPKPFGLDALARKAAQLFHGPVREP